MYAIAAIPLHSTALKLTSVTLAFVWKMTDGMNPNSALFFAERTDC